MISRNIKQTSLGLKRPCNILQLIKFYTVDKFTLLSHLKLIGCENLSAMTNIIWCLRRTCKFHHFVLLLWCYYYWRVGISCCDFLEKVQDVPCNCQADPTQFVFPLSTRPHQNVVWYNNSWLGFLKILNYVPKEREKFSAKNEPSFVTVKCWDSS